MFLRTPTEFRTELLAEVFQLHDLMKTKLSDVWPTFEEMLGKETIFERIKERWPEGRATLCQKADEKWETPRPDEALLAKLCSTLQLPISDRNLYSTALQQWPGNARAELDALQAALQAAMDEEDGDEEV
jgi:hypothetical protein